MKSAIYINEGTTQLVLTPDNEWEKNCLKMIKDGGDVSTYYGEFYECQGGWYRQPSLGVSRSEQSLIFRIDKKAQE